MKFRPAAAIAFYFLLTLLFSTLSTSSSLLQKQGHDILSLVIHDFLTCRDIIVLRQTCTDFQYLLHPNDAHMVRFCISKKKTDTNIIWEDLKYFMKQNYSAFYEMKMFYIKGNEYAVLKRVLEEKYIVNGGDKPDGGGSTIVQSQLENVKMIIPTNFAVVALLGNGNVVAWGSENLGGKIPAEIQIQLINLHVKKIISTRYAFAALLDNGTVVAWGNEDVGGKIPDEIQTQLFNVKKIISTGYAFVALLDNGDVVAWGDVSRGGKIPHEIQTQLVNVKKIFSTNQAFAALLDDGTVVAWGNEDFGGKIPHEIQTQLIDVKQIISTQKTFTALCNKGKTLTW